MTRSGFVLAWNWKSLFLALSCLVLASCGTNDRPSTAPSTTTLQGRVTPGAAPGSMQFKTESGGIYTLVSNRMSSALFIDTNLQAKTLLLKGRVWPERKFEVTGNVRSIHDGRIHELYYYCDVCVIKGIDPGPCMCCRDLVVLVEEPEANPKAQSPKSKQPPR
jgi:hypothetical protein